MDWLHAGASDVRVIFEVIAFFAAGIIALSVWAALSWRHWFLRAFVVVAAIALLLPIRAYEPALLFMVSAPMTAFVIWLVRQRIAMQLVTPAAISSIGARFIIYCYGTVALFLLLAYSPALQGTPLSSVISRPSWYEWIAFGMIVVAPAVVIAKRLWTEPHVESEIQRTAAESKVLRFSLRDLLLLMVILGSYAAMLAVILQKPLIIDWLGMLGTALCLFVIGVTTSFAVMLRQGWLVFAMGLVPAIGAVAALHTWVLPDWIEMAAIVWIADAIPRVKAFLFGFLVLATVIGVITYLLFVSGALVERGLPNTASKAVTRTARLAMVAICLTVYGPMAIVYWRMMATLPIPESSLPDTNALPHLVAAAEKLDQLNPNDLSIAQIRHEQDDPDKAQQIAEIYEEMMRMLKKPIYVPLDLTGDARAKFVDGQMSAIHKLRYLAVIIWQSEGKYAAKGKQFNRATSYGLATMRLGSKLQIGGAFVSSFNGQYIEEKGIGQIAGIRRDLSVTHTLYILEVAKEIQNSRENVQAMIAREAAFAERAYSWRVGLEREAPLVLSLMERKKMDPAQFYVSAVDRRDTMLALLIADLAVRLFQHDHGKLPESLDELQPNYLAVTPIDRFSGRPLIYRRSDSSFVLYSVGRDRKDDGGIFGTWADTHNSRFDLDLDSLNRLPATVPAANNANP